jgi:hypothetical protein
VNSHFGVRVLLPAAALGEVELAVAHSSEKGLPLIRPEDQNWSLTIF